MSDSEHFQGAQVPAGAGAVRCECQVCRSHAFAQPGVKGSGRCGNCGSDDLRPLSAPGRIRTDDLAVKSRSL